jgi:hypothetical protein
VGRRRASGRISRSTTAATTERKLATAHPLKEMDLMRAPPVENRAAAASTARREPRGVGGAEPAGTLVMGARS